MSKFRRKYIWGAEDLENELKKLAERMKQKTGIPFSYVDASYKLAQDIKNGRYNPFGELNAKPIRKNHKK